jgi:hypothetical protein
VKQKAPHIPWGRKRNRGKTKTNETKEETRHNAPEPERRLIQGCFDGIIENTTTKEEKR